MAWRPLEWIIIDNPPGLSAASQLPGVRRVAGIESLRSRWPMRLQSSWVEDEIAAAVKKERDGGRDVLIPLNLDGYFFDWKGDHSVRIQERLAADFTGWEKDNAKFEREFEKVVKALRPHVED